MDRQKTSASTSSGGISWWVQLVTIVGSMLMAAGAIIGLVNPGMLVGHQADINDAVRVFAGYFAARNLAVACLLLVLLAIRAGRALGHVTALAACIQLVDLVLDCVEGRWSIAPGVLVVGLLFFLASIKLSGHPLWRRQAWVE
jgi:hypothetical protein